MPPAQPATQLPPRQRGVAPEQTLPHCPQLFSSLVTSASPQVKGPPLSAPTVEMGPSLVDTQEPPSHGGSPPERSLVVTKSEQPVTSVIVKLKAASAPATSREKEEPGREGEREESIVR